MWTVGGKIVDGSANSYGEYTAAVFFGYVIRFIGGHVALVNVTTLIIYRGGSRVVSQKCIVYNSPHVI